MHVTVKALRATDSAPTFLRAKAADSSWSLTCPYSYEALDAIGEAAVALFRAMGNDVSLTDMAVVSRTPASTTYKIYGT